MRVIRPAAVALVTLLVGCAEPHRGRVGTIGGFDADAVQDAAALPRPDATVGPDTPPPPLELLLDVRTVRLAGHVVFDGPPLAPACRALQADAPSGSVMASALLLLRDDERGYAFEVAVGCAPDAADRPFEATIFPGLYRVTL